jgi:hypothetical protein
MVSKCHSCENGRKIPPALKYESDGGPGSERIMNLLLGSAEGLRDRKMFMTLQVMFWLLAAIAKASGNVPDHGQVCFYSLIHAYSALQ